MLDEWLSVEAQEGRKLLEDSLTMANISEVVTDQGHIIVSLIKPPLATLASHMGAPVRLATLVPCECTREGRRSWPRGFEALPPHRRPAWSS